MSLLTVGIFDLKLLIGFVSAAPIGGIFGRALPIGAMFGMSAAFGGTPEARRK